MCPMKIFISWSESRSKAMAEALKNWIPDVIQACEPWLSSEDIDPGARWSIDLAKQLEEAQFGVICLTPENLNSTWLHFEAGAISKKFEDRTRICPYLLDLEPNDVAGPLAQFQAIRANKEETRKLMQSINQTLGKDSLFDERLNRVFETFWPRLEKDLKKISEIDSSRKQTKRSANDMLEEILKIIRDQSRIASFGVQLTESNASKIPKRRDKLEIFRDILILCDERNVKKRDLVHVANLGASTTAKYLNWLIRNGMICEEENTLHITPKGNEFLSALQNYFKIIEI